MKISQYTPPISSTLSDLFFATATRDKGGANKTYSNNRSSFTLESTATDALSPLLVSDQELQGLIAELNATDASAETQNLELDPRMFFEWMQSLSEEDQKAMHSFHRKIIDASQGETLNETELAALVEQAPEALQEFAASQGISLETFIQNSAQHKGQRPEPSALQSELMDFFQSQGVDPRQEGMKDFFGQLMEISKNTEGDWSELQSQTPQVLSDFAESKGISISELLSQLVSDMQKHRPQQGPHQGQE